MAVGNYEKKQLRSPSRLVRWSHGSRFACAEELVRDLGARAVLDYGCGDGTFLQLVAPLLVEGVGADHSKSQVANAAAAHGSEPKLRFVHVGNLAPSDEGRFDAVFCMEVLEHCLPRETDAVLRNLARFVSPRGAVVISVPIEIGPTLLGKHAMRRILGLARVGDYQYTEPYSAQDLVRMVLAGETTSINRPVYDGEPPFYTHKGFNWRALERRLREDFAVESRRFSPLPWTRGLASSQVWFVCRRK